MGDELRGEASSASAMAGSERSPLTVDLVSGVETGVEVSSSILAGRQGWACTLFMNPYTIVQTILDTVNSPRQSAAKPDQIMTARAARSNVVISSGGKIDTACNDNGLTTDRHVGQGDTASLGSRKEE